MHSELLWSEGVLRAEGFLEALEGDAPIEEREDRVGPIALGAVLGRGAFSSVLEGTWPDGRRCAVKRISKRCTKSRQEVRNVAAEHRALARLSGGPRCLELQGVLATDRYVYFAVEHFGEELYGFMKRYGGERVPRGLGDGVVHGVAAGLAFMHALDLAHRDVKPENVLVDVRGETFRDVRVKVCDLGLSAPLRRRKAAGDAAASPDCVTRALEGAPPPSPYEPMFQCCGSMGFFAPDMLDPAGYDGARADVWSLGCLGLEVAAGSGAFARFWFPLYKAFFARGADDASRPAPAAEHAAFVAVFARPRAAVRAAVAGAPWEARDDGEATILRLLGDASATVALLAACVDRRRRRRRRRWARRRSRRRARRRRRARPRGAGRRRRRRPCRRRSRGPRPRRRRRRPTRGTAGCR